MLKDLGQTAGPADRGINDPLQVSYAEKNLLCVLRQESVTGLAVLCLAPPAGFDGYRGPDRLTVTFLSTQAECDRVAKLFHDIVQDPELRRVSVLENDFQSSIVV